MLKQSKKRVICLFVTLMLVLSMSAVAFADAEGTSNEARAELYSTAYNSTKGKQYELEQGGSIDGGQLWTIGGSSVGEGSLSADGSTIKDGNQMGINESNYEMLSSSGKKSFTKDFTSSVNDQLAANEKKAATDGGYSNTMFNKGTVSTWYKSLQLNSTIGTQLMSDILAGTKPDFASAQRIYQPFSGVIGTLMGILSILIIALLGLVMVLDIAYIVLPPFRMLVGDESGNSNGGKGITSHLISSNAKKAVETAENGDGDKQALAIYFKKQVIALIILGICIMYLINGQIYTFVGWLLDLVSGFLGF